MTRFRAGEYDPAVKEKRAILPGFRRELERIPPYRVFTPAHEIKLNQNESPIDLPAALREQILIRLRETPWNRYPDYPARPLESLIAKRIRVAKARVMVGHASNELLYATALATLERGKTMVTGAPGYPVAKLAATLAGGRIVEVPADARYQYEVDPIIAAIRKHDPRLVFLPSPNNPTGSTLSRDDVARICDATGNLVMIDEAYREFSGIAIQALLGRFRNLVLLRTLSKAARLAAFRIGYLVGDPDVLSRIERAKPPHSIDVPAQIAGETLFASRDMLKAEIARVRRERTRVMKSFAKLPGVDVFPSRANFFLIRTEDAADFDKALLAQGILIRAVGAAPTAPPALRNCLRISLGTNRENNALVAAARRYFRGGDR
ncbi:MAG: aminotransferase class I/II-fold pyridoxal phosphate-dependent enzyme [Gemmatimonadetes bacterium]|nr:aminotransferase class I/II-fold pyridoxal phosphate-dependent enzyme [Gemmatimonadota bacterium]